MSETGLLWEEMSRVVGQRQESLVLGSALPFPLRTHVLSNPTGGRCVLKRDLNSRLPRRQKGPQRH